MILRLALSLTIGLTLLAGVIAQNPCVIDALRAPQHLQEILRMAR